jgi:predicted short-subunit dehydrogenase-like oxidoreductase (DUF2520 family)
MKIVLIGTGHVATVLGHIFKQHGHQIVQVFGRNRIKTAALSRLLDAEIVNGADCITKEAGLYVIAVSDNAIENIAAQLHLQNQLVVHTAGSVPKEILKPASASYGVLYPLQSLHAGTSKPLKIPFLIDASSAENLQQLQQLVGSINSDWQICSNEQRLNMHLAAIWVNNFPTLLYSIAFRICQEKDMSFGLLLPLLQETAARIGADDPVIKQTGPAIRGDVQTMEKHQQLLHTHPLWLSIYNQLSTEIGAISAGD